MSWEHANQMLVKEHLGLFKSASNYDVFDLHSGEKLLECREPNLGWFTKALRFTDYRRNTPFDVHIADAQGNLVVQVKRGISIFLSKVDVLDGDGQRLGGFSQKLFTIGGAFTVYDNGGREVCQLKGKWTSWDFQFLVQGMQLARVTKKWQGIGKEMFTTADNYVLEISENLPPGSQTRKLILAAVMCIDMVLKE
ncbi:MAG TPA: phospholipid scramblase-related protein [Lacipirellula sp.]